MPPRSSDFDCAAILAQVASANWSNLTEAIETFKSTDYLYHGGPLGNKLNATVREQYTPIFRNSSKNITYAYLEVMSRYV